MKSTNLTAICFVLLFTALLPAAEPAPSGPAAEKRFPPLKLPTGFKATLYACDPFIEYPSVIANGPKNGSLFVGVDYMTGLGTEIIRRSEVRLLEDTDGDGYADKSTVYAKEFNSIQGLAYHGGHVYVMHAPFLTRLRDTKETGVADERKDLLEGLGLTPEKNPVRLHCANGVVVGHDGWLYLAMGDNGTNVKRPEGDRLVLNGGGILRCRKDGADLHVFATGTRNIYDVAFDEDLNIFFRDNENDGGDYKIRVCHSFFGADHGYPYKYYERPDEAMKPIGDFGLGSSAGGVIYLETQFPPEYRGNFFNCEWGRSVVRCVPKREGSGFAQLKEIEFAAGAEGDPYGFKPTDLVVDRDGSLFVSDWCDGQRPKRGRGRIYRISYQDDSVPERGNGGIKSDRYFQRIENQERLEYVRNGSNFVPISLRSFKELDARASLHVIWLMANASGANAIDWLFEVTSTVDSPRIKAQAIRALADLADPVLVKHRLDAGPGEVEHAKRFANLAEGKDPAVLLEIVIALGRLRWSESPRWLNNNIAKPDATLAHAAMMTLRKSGNWRDVLKLLDLSDDHPMRAIALRALAEQVVPDVADGLIERLKKEQEPTRRREYADLLTRIYKKQGEWVYWGYRPPPRPANAVAWDKTSAIEAALNDVLANADTATRLFVAKRMQREKVPARLAALTNWLRDENNADSLMVVLDLLREHPANVTRELLVSAIGERQKPAAVRLEALKLFAGGLDEKSEEQLLELAKKLDDAPVAADGLVLAEALRLLIKRPKLNSAELFQRRVLSYSAAVRAAAIEGIGELKIAAGAERVIQRLADRDSGVRRAAAASAGKLNLVETADKLLKLARDPDPGVRRASFESLRLLKEKRALPLAIAALNDPETQLAGVQCVAELGGREQAKALVDLVKQNQSAEVFPVVVQALTKWNDEQSVADLQGMSGVFVRWETAAMQPVFGSGLESRIHLKHVDGQWKAAGDLCVAEKTDVQFLLGSNAAFRLSLNGKQVFKRGDVQPYRPDSERFDAVLEKGMNRVLLEFPDAKADIDFHLRFRRKSATAAHEKLIAAALARPGNVEKGRLLYLNAERSQCIKCHRVGEQGEKIGPELSGLGNRFSRIHIVESILEPSRTIGPAFQSFAVTLADGRTLIGIKIDEADKTVTYADKDGKKHVLMKADIEATRPEKLSVMPEGLEKPLSVDEFVDLIAYLVSLKETRPK